MQKNEPQPDEMSFIDHLSELRNRLVISLATILVLSIFSFTWATNLFELLTFPLREGAGPAVRLIGTGPAEAFIVKLKVALGAGCILAAPMIFYQIWQFVAPGLLEHEKRYAAPFVLGSTFFFALGIAFCYFLVLPLAFEFFVKEFNSIGVSPEIRIGEYLSFTIRIILVFGAVFELPILSFFGSLIGLVSASWLKSNGRMAIISIFIVAAIVTPPDVVTQCLLAVPLLLLYLLCIVIAQQVENSKAKLQLASQEPAKDSSTE